MRNKIIALLFGVVIIIGVFFLYNLNQQNTKTTGKILVGASFYPMYYFASQIGGDKAEVYNITPAGSEPHDYEPTTGDIVKIYKSKMLILNGGQLEPWGDKTKDELRNSNVLVVTAGEGLANRKIEEDGQTITDPHIWLDPVLAKKEVGVIEKGFEKIDPDNASYYQLNAKKLEAELDNLDFAYKKGLSSCVKKDFVTSHAAFGYLASTYGINQVAISGVSPDEEPSPATLAEISSLVKQQNIKIIFFESLVSPKLSDTIASETGAKTAVLDPIEGITEENLIKGETYITVMKQNLVSLREALECSK